MFGTLSVALLLAASPAPANEPAQGASAPAAPEYKIKKVCRTVEVAGSFIPRTSCVNRKVPVKRPDATAQQPAKAESGSADASGQEQQQQ